MWLNSEMEREAAEKERKDAESKAAHKNAEKEAAPIGEGAEDSRTQGHG